MCSHHACALALAALSYATVLHTCSAGLAPDPALGGRGAFGFAPPPGAERRYFDQKVDHFEEGEGEGEGGDGGGGGVVTWQQAFFVEDEHWDRSDATAPVFLYIGGEVSAAGAGVIVIGTAQQSEQCLRVPQPRLPAPSSSPALFRRGVRGVTGGPLPRRPNQTAACLSRLSLARHVFDAHTRCSPPRAQ